MKESEIGLIIVGFLILLALVAGGLYLYHKSRFNEYPAHEDQDVKAKLTNQTTTPYLIVTQRGSFLSQPGETTMIHLKRHEDISASTPDVEFIHRFSNDKVNHLHITPDGFRTNLTSSKDVDFVNASEYPVIFTQKSSKGGVYYVLDTVPPLSASEGHFVGSRSTWEVFSLGEVPLASIHLGGSPVSRLVFDGVKLRAY